MYDTLIIGAGMSGLAAGVRLAYYDQRVCILERHTAIGGLNSYYRRGGRNFDVGLHAVTNFSPKGARQGPLARLLRQLRLTWDEFALAPQLGSTIAFPGISLRFSNDFELLRSEIRSHFPRQMDRFDRLVGEIADYDQFGEQCNRRSARAVVGALVDEPLLVEMIFCPVLFYGGCREQDLEFGQFSVLFRSIFLEGLARPLAGVRLILDKLVRKFKEMGGELRLRTGVSRILVKNQTVDRVVLDNGSELSARRILSSAGWPETMRLCDDSTGPAERVGKLSFVESISTLDCPPRDLGLDRTTVFFNDSAEFCYARPDDLADLRSGVVCSPNNFVYSEPMADNTVRITALANYDRWAALDPQSYRLAKLRWYDKMAASAVRFVPDFRSAVVNTDMFTPTTIRRFTGAKMAPCTHAPTNGTTAPRT